VPPLREAPDDIRCWCGIRAAIRAQMGKSIDNHPERHHERSDALSLAWKYSRVAESAGACSDAFDRAGCESAVEDLPVQAFPAAAGGKMETLEAAERRHILDAWSVELGDRRAAGCGGGARVERSTLQARMDKLGIRRARRRLPGVTGGSKEGLLVRIGSARAAMVRLTR